MNKNDEETTKQQMFGLALVMLGFRVLQSSRGKKITYLWELEASSPDVTVRFTPTGFQRDDGGFVSADQN